MSTIAVLKDGTEVKIAKVSRFFNIDDSILTVNIDMSSNNITMEEVICIFTKENTKKITIKSDYVDDVEINNYAIENIFENSDISYNSVSVSLSKKVANLDKNLIISDYKVRYEKDKEEEAAQKAAQEAEEAAAAEELDSLIKEVDGSYTETIADDTVTASDENTGAAE
jgi:hypothetical protein